MTNDEQKKLEDAIEIIDVKAKALGLDYFDTEFLIADEELMDQLRAYVLPVRFHHWTFGKEYQKTKTLKKYGATGTIYECVINSNPAYGFLSENNNLTEMKLVIAHVFGHVDFFTNNMLFGGTNRRMATDCALNARKIADYSFKYGEEVVERWIDACMAISRHCELAINYQSDRIWLNEAEKIEIPIELDLNDEFDFMFQKEKIQKIKQWQEEQKRSHPIMEKDLLLFLMYNRFANLEMWQKDIMSIVRDEMRYFIPNIQTKISNEGWAVFWHQKIIEELDLECDFLKDETNDWYTFYAAMNAGVLHPGSRGNLNPYLLGYTIFNNIYKNTEGTEEEKLEKLFDIRASLTDSSLVRNHLNEEICEELDLFTFELLGDAWTVTETHNWERSRDILANQLAEAHIPTMYVVDDDYHNDRELYLMHDYKGEELDDESARRTLGYIARLWRRPITLKTGAKLTYESGIDKDNNKKSFLGEDVVVHITLNGKKADVILEHEPIKSVSQAAEEYYDAKWRRLKFEEQTKENSEDENIF